MLTQNGFNSNFVQQEIGYAKSLKKPHLYIVEKGLQKKITGFAFGKDFIELDPINPNVAIKKAIRLLLSHWRKLIQIKKKQEKDAAWFIAGIIGLTLMSNSD